MSTKKEASPKKKSGLKAKGPYKTMITKAIKEDGKRKGTSLVAIGKFIQANYDVPENFKVYVNQALRRGVEDGSFIKIKMSYKLPPKRAASGTTKTTPKKAITTRSKSEKEKKEKKEKKEEKSPKKTPEKKTTKKATTKTETKKSPKKTPEKKEASTPSPRPKRTAVAKKAVAKAEKAAAKKTEGVTKPAPKRTAKAAAATTDSPKPTPTRARSTIIEKATPTPRAAAPKPKATPTPVGPGGAFTGELQTVADPSNPKVSVTTQTKKGRVSLAGTREKPAFRRAPSMFIEKGPTLQPVKERNTRIELVFCFDTTGSMYSALDEVRKHINQIVSTLMGDIPGLRIAIIAHGDYEQYGKEPYIVKKLDFSTNPTEITQFVESVERTGGGDFPEAYELAMREAQKLTWSEGYMRNMVIIGDATPHPKNNRHDDIDWEEELKELVDTYQVRIYAVQCLNNSGSDTFYQTLADKSGGTRLTLSDFGSMKEIFLGLCYREATEFQYQAHAKQIAALKRGDSAKLLLPEELDMTELEGLAEADILKVHNAIHDSTMTNVKVGDHDYEIAIGEAGCRFIRTAGGIIFIEQNKEKDNKYARMALEGKSITWICHTGRWGLVIDDTVVRK